MGLRAEDHPVENSMSNIQGKGEMEDCLECLEQGWRGRGSEKMCLWEAEDPKHYSLTESEVCSALSPLRVGS